jgi:hypothetical protein
MIRSPAHQRHASPGGNVVVVREEHDATPTRGTANRRTIETVMIGRYRSSLNPG